MKELNATLQFIPSTFTNQKGEEISYTKLLLVFPEFGIKMPIHIDENHKHEKQVYRLLQTFAVEK